MENGRLKSKQYKPSDPVLLAPTQDIFAMNFITTVLAIINTILLNIGHVDSGNNVDNLHHRLRVVLYSWEHHNLSVSEYDQSQFIETSLKRFSGRPTKESALFISQL